MSRPVARYAPSRRYLWMALIALAGMAFSMWIALRWGAAWHQVIHRWSLEVPVWFGSGSSHPVSAAPPFFPALFSPAIFSPAWVAAILFGIPAAILLALAFRPPIEIHEARLRIGRREIPWEEIRRVDQTGWTVPLAVRLTMVDGERLLLIYPGDLEGSTLLLRHLRRYPREALLDGVPYRQFWGEPSAPAPRQMAAPPRYPLLSPEDEEEVERMFQRLKSVGHLDQRKSNQK